MGPSRSIWSHWWTTDHSANHCLATWYIFICSVIWCIIRNIYQFDSSWSKIYPAKKLWCSTCVQWSPVVFSHGLPITLDFHPVPGPRSWQKVSQRQKSSRNDRRLDQHTDCQHLNSLATGHQYLGRPGPQSQIEQSSSHMRPPGSERCVQWSLIAFQCCFSWNKKNVVFTTQCLSSMIWSLHRISWTIVHGAMVIRRHLALLDVAVMVVLASSHQLYLPRLFVSSKFYFYCAIGTFLISIHHLAERAEDG